MIRVSWFVLGIAAGSAACGIGVSRPQRTEPTTGMRFVQIDAGRFVMGTPADEAGRQLQEMPHDVSFSAPLWMGAHEVTQGQWQAVMGENPSWFRNRGDARPVERVNWFQVKTFLQRLGEQSGGDAFRLPTEAEWEYACRAGTSTPYAVGTTLSASQANFDGTPETAGEGQTKSVGSYAPNAWGLYDMHGNVWEWTEDEHCPYPTGPLVDPRAATCGSEFKVIRGGSWYFGADSARCGLRYTHRPQDLGFSLGFRVMWEPRDAN